jgi:putative peptidoglycan lipid II flippase
MIRRTRTDIPLLSTGLAIAFVSALSLALGYGREILVAHQFGASRVTDAFFVAYFTPQIVFQLLVTGPLVWALTPLFTQVRVRDGNQAHDRLAGGTLTLAVAIMVPLVAVWMIFSSEIAGVIAPSYQGSAKAMTADLTRIMAPQLITYGAGAVLTAVLYSRGRILLPISAQLVNNVVVFVLIVLLKPTFGIQGVAIAVVIASVAFLATLFIFVLATGRGVWPRAPRLGHHGRRLATGIAPLVAISMLSQIPGFAERAFASGLPGGELAGLAYGYRLLQLAIIAVSAMTTVAFVGLAASAAEHDREGFRKRVAENLHLNVKFSIFAVGATVVLAPQLVGLAYSGGQISVGDEHLISVTTAMAAAGLPLIAVIGAFQQPLFATSRWRPLAVLTGIQTAVNVAASAVLISVAGYRGFVAANVFALFIAAVGYVAYSWRRYGLSHRLLARSVVHTAVATALASFVLLGLHLFGWNHGAGRVGAALYLGLDLAVYASVVLVVLAAARDETALALIRMVQRRALGYLGGNSQPRISPSEWPAKSEMSSGHSE